MTTADNIWITGYGLVTALGCSSAEIWRNMENFAAERTGVDTTTFSPYPVHMLPAFPAEEEIAQRADRRAMGPTMLAGVFAAGRALQQAQLKQNPALLKKTELIVACHCNDRDEESDELILSSVASLDDPAETLNKKLLESIRPTLFLTQLPNILASNISIVFGVTGPSLTLLGEETAGANALQLAWQRLRNGEAEIILVGAAFMGQNRYGMLQAAASGSLLQGEFTDVWARDGVCMGGGAAFIVMERAQSRDVKPIARMAQILNHRSKRAPGARQQTAMRQWSNLAQSLNGSAIDVVSSASGKADVTAEELRFWKDLQDEGKVSSLTGISTGVGLLRDAAVPVNVAMALSCLERGSAPPALSRNGVESRGNRSRQVDRILANTWGFTGGEIMVLLEKVYE